MSSFLSPLLFWWIYLFVLHKHKHQSSLEQNYNPWCLAGVTRRVVGWREVTVGANGMRLTDVYTWKLFGLKYKLVSLKLVVDMIRGGIKEFLYIWTDQRAWKGYKLISAHSYVSRTFDPFLESKNILYVGVGTPGWRIYSVRWWWWPDGIRQIDVWHYEWLDGACFAVGLVGK